MRSVWQMSLTCRVVRGFPWWTQVHRQDAYDNAFVESVKNLFKTEVSRRQGPWCSLEAVEFATLAWVDWFNTRQLPEPIGYLSPAEYEVGYYQQAAVA